LWERLHLLSGMQPCKLESVVTRTFEIDDFLSTRSAYDISKTRYQTESGVWNGDDLERTNGVLKLDFPLKYDIPKYLE
jgi:hypothetical protein